MKKYIYILLAATALCGCSRIADVEPAGSSSSVEILEDGSMRIGVNLSVKAADVVDVSTRASSLETNIIDGWAVVFGEDPSSANMYGDDSPLIQKVAFRTNAAGKAFVTFDEYEGFCYIRLFGNLTSYTQSQIDELVSAKDIADGTAQASEPSTFKDYKHIDVGLDGYYEDVDAPNPQRLRSDVLGFPCASPGIEMPRGLILKTVEALDNTNVTMVPVASKVDVTSECDFDLLGARLYNGAKKALMRSSVLEDDGVSQIASLPLPTNLGGVNYSYVEASATGGTTAAWPIYFFPNEGDDPYTEDPDLTQEQKDLATYDDEYDTDEYISDVINRINPTYIIIRGRAAGFGGVEGYYKIAIHCALHDNTRDVMRNGHYRILLKNVDNPGYATEQQAIDGPANDISYDIVLGGGMPDDFGDPRAETVVAHNGFFHLEFVGSEVFAQGYGTHGVTGEFGLKLQRNDQIDSRYDIPTLHITASEGITINSPATVEDDNFAGNVSFTARQSGTITVRCGDVLKAIPVHYLPTPHVWQGSSTIGGAVLGRVGEFAVDADTGFSGGIIDDGGNIAENTLFKNREYRGKVYPTDMSNGIRKVYCRQASNFDMTSYYDNSSQAATGGNIGENNIFSLVSSGVDNNVYQASINYQSTGKVYQVNDENRGGLDDENIMTSWSIGTAPIDFRFRGEFTASYRGNLSSYFTTDDWDGIADGATLTLDADNIGTNQLPGSDYDPARAQVSNSGVVTLTNIAGQTKTYNINLSQYARPYINDQELTYDQDNDMYIWNCPLVADIYWAGSNTLGDYVYSPTVYNARYRSGDEGVGDWVWSEAPNEGDWHGGSSGVTYLRDAVGVTSDPDSQGDSMVSRNYRFKIQVTTKSSLVVRSHWQAYFDLKMTNGSNERIFLRFRIRRND